MINSFRFYNGLGTHWFGDWGPPSLGAPWSGIPGTPWSRDSLVRGGETPGTSILSLGTPDLVFQRLN